MKRLVTIGLAVGAALIAVFAVVVALQPSEYRVERSLAMSAPLEKVFPQVNELKNWAAWNPWQMLDPDMAMTYTGPEAGTGASYSWRGDRNVGEGKMTITGSRPHESVQIKLEFFKPMAGVADVEFTFKPRGDQTVVTWAMRGENNFVGKAFCLFMDMDAMIGSQFEKGLANLKAKAEAPAP